MSEILVNIAHKDYRIACEPGQEAHLTELASQLDGRLEGLKQHFGEIGDIRLCVMACLQLLDEAHDAKAQNDKMKSQLLRLGEAHKALSQRAENLEMELATRLGDAARRLATLTETLMAHEVDPVEPAQTNPAEVDVGEEVIGDQSGA